MSKLTAVQIRQAKPKDKPYKLPDGQGLYFHMSPSLEKAHGVTVSEWTARSLSVFWGNTRTMSLEQARKARSEAREQVKAGKNPSHEQQKAEQAAAANSFEAVAREWMERQPCQSCFGHIGTRCLPLSWRLPC